VDGNQYIPVAGQAQYHNTSLMNFSEEKVKVLAD